MPQTPCLRANEGHQTNYTPSGAVVAAGQVVVVGELVGIAPVAIADGKQGVLDLDGTWDCPKVSGAITANQRLYWDATADPVGGTAGSGALTATAGATKPFAGIAAAAAANTDGKVKLLLNRVAPKAANVAAEATANGSDAATTQALANALKTKVNAILTALKDAGLMATA